MFSRIFRFVLAVCVLLCAVPAGAVGASESSVVLEGFLSDLRVPKSAREKLIHGLSGGEELAVSTREEGGALYCLALVPVPPDSDADVAQELELSSQERALFLARGRLAMTLGGGGLKKRYPHEDALGSALYSFYAKQAGIEAAADVLDGGNNRFAAALAWLSSESANTLSKTAPTEEAVNSDYCRFLYLNHAKSLFDDKDYVGALPLFKEIHDLRWMDIDAYLDAAECFLRTGEPKKCLKLLQELRATLDAEMGSRNLERAGRLCREAGDRKAALDAFKAARKRFHEGR